MSNASYFLDQLKKGDRIIDPDNKPIEKGQLILFKKIKKKVTRGGIHIDDPDFKKIANEFIESLQSSQDHLARLKRKVLDCGEEKDNAQTRLLLEKFNELYRMTNGMINL